MKYLRISNTQLDQRISQKPLLTDIHGEEVGPQSSSLGLKYRKVKKRGSR